MVRLERIGHQYGNRTALNEITLAVRKGECFAVLGPNGGGKTTLFRILSTLLPPTSGTAEIDGLDVNRDRSRVRSRIGVVFQSPSLDVYLTARENLRHGGRLYGLSGRALEARIEETLDQMAVGERADELVKKLSGGLRRRVELAKVLLHRPPVLLLDEPSTGLDPSARMLLWTQLKNMQDAAGTTILLTTHFMEEADRCDRLAILDRGRLVTVGTPNELKSRIGGDCITIECEDPAGLSGRIVKKFHCEAAVVKGAIRIERSDGPAFVPQLATAFGSEFRSVTVGKPTLEDVFVHETGHRFDDESDTESSANHPAGA